MAESETALIQSVGMSVGWCPSHFLILFWVDSFSPYISVNIQKLRKEKIEEQISSLLLIPDLDEC